MTTTTTIPVTSAVVPTAVRVHDVLCVTDLSTLSESAVAHARFLAERFHAELTVYHAVEELDRPYPYLAVTHGHEVTEAAQRLARTLLAAQLEGMATRCSSTVEVVASAREAVVDMVRGRRPDLTVMATHGRSGWSHRLLGSTTEEVVQRAHTPVLCLRSGAAVPYKRIVVPTDFSLASRLAFPMAAFLAREFDAEVIGVHVVPPPTVAALSGIPGPVVPMPTEPALWEFLRPDFVGLGITAQVESGSAWDRIVHTAEVERADLIVMSTRGHDSLSDRIVGSTTERVLRHAPCPVLVA